MTASHDYDVVVAGYGPVGAVAANLLGQLDLRVAVFEPTTSVYHLPRAAHFDAEIMQVFESLGLADDIRPATAQIIGMDCVTAAGDVLLHLEPPDDGPAFMFYQPDLERALRAGVERLASVDVHLGHAVTAIDAHDTAVRVSVQDVDTGAERDVTAAYLLGCDGARSLVRASTGIALEDLEFDQPWLVVDTMLRCHVDLPTVALQICDPARPATFIPSAGRHRRWEFMLLPGEDPATMEDPATYFELLAPWVRPDDVEVVRAVVYSFHALIAERWRDGRVFLVGDAAHQMPPFLGQGMCSGIRDAQVLVPKLAEVLAGRAADALLDTYESERKPQVRSVAGLAVDLGRIIQTTDHELAAARDADFCARRKDGEPAGLDALACWLDADTLTR